MRWQMGKLYWKWGWVRVLLLVLWLYVGDGSGKRVVEWEGFNELFGIIKNQVDLLKVGFNVDVGGGSLLVLVVKKGKQKKVRSQFFLELWSMIFEFLGDWELVMSLGVYIIFEVFMGEGWRRELRDKGDLVGVFMYELEWMFLGVDMEEICRKLVKVLVGFCDLSVLVVYFIFKFFLMGVLIWIEGNLFYLFKCFDGKMILIKVLVYYGRMDILEWWRKSLSFLEKQYDCEVVDKVLMRGFVYVLEWWRRSGLLFKYSEVVFEGVSLKGYIYVLEWWREVSLQNLVVVLKLGKVLLGVVQWGMVEVIRWWEESGILVGYYEVVCKMVSWWGQVEVLECWRWLRGDDKLEFDNQILMEVMYYVYIYVLEWWRKYVYGELLGMNGKKGRRVEYKIMDVEEVLEDFFGDQIKVRRWWVENGLNLGLGIMEWMKIKVF